MQARNLIFYVHTRAHRHRKYNQGTLSSLNHLSCDLIRFLDVLVPTAPLFIQLSLYLSPALCIVLCVNTCLKWLRSHLKSALDLCFSGAARIWPLGWPCILIQLIYCFSLFRQASLLINGHQQRSFHLRPLFTIVNAYSATRQFRSVILLVPFLPDKTLRNSPHHGWILGSWSQLIFAELHVKLLLVK